MFPVYLGLGSNLGDRESHLLSACRRLEERGFHIRQRSGLYLTEPVGGPPQDWYLNAVVEGETSLSPEALLQTCLATERDHGRVREVPLEPRTLDLDLLLYGEEVRGGPELILPHPRFHQRLFVLVPLAEIAPRARHPLLGLTAVELREACRDSSRVLPFAAEARPSP